MSFTSKFALLPRSIFKRSYAAFSTSYLRRQSLKEPLHDSSLSKKVSSDLPSTSLKSKVRQGVSDAGYTAVIIGGVALTGFIFYFIARELFSGKSPTRVYEEALKLCVSDDRVQNLLGSAITGYGETSRRGRSTRVASTDWVDKDGRRHMVMRFYLKGPIGSGTVHLEVYENDVGEFDYRYLLVDVDGLTKRQVILRPDSASTESTKGLQN